MSSASRGIPASDAVPKETSRCFLSPLGESSASPANPKACAAFLAALQEATDIINKDNQAAAELYIHAESWKDLFFPQRLRLSSATQQPSPAGGCDRTEDFP